MKCTVCFTEKLHLDYADAVQWQNYEMHCLFHRQLHLDYADTVQWQKEMYQGACMVHCRLKRNSQSRQFIHQQWLTEQLPILMKVSSCHICVSINDKDHDLGNARLLVPHRCVQLLEAISSQCCPLWFAPWWFLKVSPQLIHYVLQNLSFLIMNLYFLLSSFKMKITTNTQIIKHMAHLY